MPTEGALYPCFPYTTGLEIRYSWFPDYQEGPCSALISSLEETMGQKVYT